MVLLTSSTISAAISISVVCLFTFLLFLSGYVLQQRTVRSLQEALRRPESRPIYATPPKIIVQDPIVGDAFQFSDSKAPSELRTGDFGQNDENEQSLSITVPADVAEETNVGEVTVNAIVDGTADIQIGEGQILEIGSSQSQGETQRLAYILSLPNPSALCSAILFSKSQRSSSQLDGKADIIFLYPSTWETQISNVNLASLKLMRDVQDELDISYYPVTISSVWEGVGIQSQLLGELQRHKWDYDRLMYLRSPGLLLDTNRLDMALKNSNIKKSWAPISSSTGMNPDILLISASKGMLVPRGEMRQLTTNAIALYNTHKEAELTAEVLAQSTAYMTFDEAELEQRKEERALGGELFETFERGRWEVCKGRGILDGDNDKLDLRKIR